ncbi:hypothetical protein BBJ28_00000578 [Nothophytophthora sp. Chile5]|nr:hypothetical protein BBJ28_00000578 [Nothophytophthora sp. Chile5]
MAEMEKAALQAFEPTWVVYDPTDPLGVVLALITLSPVYVTVMYVTLVGFQRDLDSISALLGQLINEVLNKVLKKAINQPRPDGAHLSGSGMPSAHSQFIAFFAAYVIAYTMNNRRLVGQWLTIVSVFMLAVLTCYSRAHLGYHSIEQIAVGALIGMLSGFAWNALVSARTCWSKVSPWLFPLVVRSRLAQSFFLRDISHIPDLIVYQHELCYSKVGASSKSKAQ